MLCLRFLYQPAVLLGFRGLHLLRSPGPLEIAVLQSFIQQEAVTHPIQCLESTPPSPTDQKLRLLKWLRLKLTLYQIDQSINAALLFIVTLYDLYHLFLECDISSLIR